jgi:hypothetical protein
LQVVSQLAGIVSREASAAQPHAGEDGKEIRVTVRKMTSGVDED